MTAATLSRLPMTAGGALAGSLARGGYWTLTRLIDFGFLAAAQFMRAPIAISTIAAIAGLSLLAANNALYFQAGRHPAPLFFSPARHAAPSPVVRPVIPAPRPRFQPAIDNETTGSVGAPATDAIDTADVVTLQTKLSALKLFDGPIDGMFGRRTATAIKAFETKSGLKPRGKLSRELLAAVMAAPVPQAQPLPVAQPRPPTAIVANAAPGAKPAATQIAPARSPAPGKPVPLAPLQPVPAALPQVAAAAPTPPVDTFAANSVPDGQNAEQSAAPDPEPAAMADAAPADPAPTDPVAQSSVVTMNSPPPVAAATAQPAPSPQPVAAPQAAAPVAGDAGLSPAQKLAAQMGTLPPAAAPATVASYTPPVDTSSDPGDNSGSTDPALITRIQRGLASLGFLGQKIDGVPGEGTAKAIRNFEVFYDYKVTGLASPQLLNLLVQHGAQT